jgi:hypothetical protein
LYLIIIGSLSSAVGQILISELFLSPVRIAWMVVLPALAGLAAIVLLFLTPSAQLLGLMCGTAAAIAIYSAEWYLELKGGPRMWAGWTPWQASEESSYPPMCGKYVDVMEEDGSIRSVLSWRGKELQPVGGISFNPIIKGRYNPLGKDLYSDRYGFENPPGQWLQDGIQILAVGDSFARGAQVEYGKGFVDLIREELGPTVNLGCSWNGPLFELASLVEYGPMVRSKFVAWFFYEGNDLNDLELARHSPLLMRYLQDGFEQSLPQKQPIIDRLLKDYVDARMNRSQTSSEQDAVPLSYVVYGNRAEKTSINWGRVLALGNLRRNLRKRWGRNYGRYRYTFDLLHEILARAASVVEGWDGRFIFVYLPGKHRFRNSIANIEADAYRQETLAVVKSLDIPVIDLTQVFDHHEMPMSLFGGHYSIEGNALVARTFVTAIKAGLPAD